MSAEFAYMTHKMRDRKWRNMKLQTPKVRGISNYKNVIYADSANIVKRGTKNIII